MNLNEIANINEDGSISLKAGQELTAEVASVLASHEGPVEVWDIDTMPVQFAETIVNHIGKSLRFNHSNADGPRLTDRVAEILATYKGTLTLNDINKLNYGDLGSEVAIAKALANHKGGELYLNGLSQLSEEAATELLKHEGPVHLEGLEDVTDQVCQMLEEANSRWFC